MCVLLRHWAPNIQLAIRKADSLLQAIFCNVWDAAVQQWLPTCYVQSADGLFTFHGTCQPDASWTGNNIKLQVKGHKQIEFHDGGQVDIISPIQYIKGELRARWLQAESLQVSRERPDGLASLGWAFA